MAAPDRPWYTLTSENTAEALKHLFTDTQLATALRIYRYIRRDLPNGRVDLRWAEEGLPPHGEPFDGQVWVGDRMVAQQGEKRVAMLLHKLRAASAGLDPPLEWE